MRKKLSALLALCLSLALTVLPASAALSVEDGRELLQENYVEEIPEEILKLKTLDEILKALDDPYTDYMSAEEFQQMLDRINGMRRVGVGLQIAVPEDENGGRIVSVLPNSPAREAGMQPGQRIVAVNGIPVTAQTDLAAVLGGAEGTQVTVTVRSADGTETKDYTLTRAPFTIPTVDGQYIGSTGYISCTSFGDRTAEEMKDVLDALPAAKTLVIDLCANPGGTIQSVSDTLSLFTDRSAAAYFRNQAGRYTSAVSLGGDAVPNDTPLVLLQGPDSASGAEIFAGAVRDYNLGISLGRRSFGKGIAQVVFNEDNCPGMFDGDNLKVTKYRIYTPAGTAYHHIGILPTLMLSEENTLAAGLLLSAGAPEDSLDHMKLELLGHTYYLDARKGLSEPCRPAFTELLEALPPSAKLSLGSGGSGWLESTPERAAERYGLDCAFRTFTDISESPYLKEIETLAAYDLVDGVGDGRYLPQENVTRAQFCAMVTNALALPIPEQNTVFSDVREEDWFAGCVAAAAKEGLFKGDGLGRFNPNEEICYQEMLAVLSNIAVRVHIGTELTGNDGLSASEYVHYYGFAEWAQKAARNMGNMDVKMDILAPTEPVTRERATALLCHTMEKTGLLWAGTI